MGRNHSGPKHLSHGRNSIEPRRGQNLTASSQNPFWKSLRMHENEIARPIREHRFEFANPEKRYTKNEGAES